MVRTMLRLPAVALLLTLGACGSNDLLGPSEQGGPFVQQLQLAGFEESVLAGPAQVEVALLSGGLTARELAVRLEGQAPEERIQSRIVALNPSEGGGSVTVALGELRISFDAETRFWIQGDEVSREAFVEEVGGALAEGHQPPVVAERPVPHEPQGADDASFVARGVALTGEGSPSIRLNVDADNLEILATPQGDEPDAWLVLLGLRIQIRVRDGTTELESHNHDFERVEDFEGRVASVNLDAGSFTLESGTVVRVLDRTEVLQEEGLLRSLAGVAEALGAEQAVVAWGRGGVEGVEPLRLAALKVAFKVRDEEEPAVEEFEGVVASVDLEASTFTLGDGTVVAISDATEVVAGSDHSPHTLQGVVEALEAGRRVVSWGHGAFEDVEHRLAAARVVFKTPIEDFEQAVVAVDLQAASLTLESGWVVRLTGETEVLAADDVSPSTLDGVHEALGAGAGVRAWGWGFVEAVEPVRLEGRKVTFRRVEG